MFKNCYLFAPDSVSVQELITIGRNKTQVDDDILIGSSLDIEIIKKPTTELKNQKPNKGIKNYFDYLSNFIVLNLDNIKN